MIGGGSDAKERQQTASTPVLCSSDMELEKITYAAESLSKTGSSLADFIHTLILQQCQSEKSCFP
jgi:hypothetical protein